MADYFSEFWNELEARIKAVWTDKNLTFYDEQTRRVNWRVMIEEGSIVLPMAVIQVGPAIPTDDFGMTNKTHMYNVQVFYVRSSSPLDTEQPNTAIRTLVETKMYDLFKDLWQTTSLSKFQLMGEPGIDVGVGNAANSVFVEASAPYIAGQLSLQALVGETL